MSRGAALMATALAACSAPRGSAASLPLEVLFAGCAAVVRGPICELGPDRRVRLWVPAPTPELQTSATVISKVARGEGTAVELVVPAGDHEVRVTTPDGRAFRLPVANAEVTQALFAALQAKRDGQLSQARALLLAAGSLSETATAQRASLLARVSLAEGDAEAAIEGLSQSMALHRQLGRLSEQLNDGFALSWVLVHHGRRFGEAREVLRGLHDASLVVAEGAAQLPHYQALVASESGDVRGALALLRVAEARAQNLSMSAQSLAVDQLFTLQLVALGRHDEALARLERLEAAGLPEDACQAATLLNNLGWAALHTGQPPSRAAAKFEAAAAHFSGRCPRPADEANAQVNLALALLLSTELDRAAAAVVASRAADRNDGRLELWRLDIEARLALARGNPRAAAALAERLERLASAANAPEAAWRAAISSARAFDALGSPALAVRAYARAEAVLDEEYRRLPFGEGLHSLLSEREAASGAALELLLSQGNSAQALALARRARSRVLRHLAITERIRKLHGESRVKWERAVSSFRAGRDALDHDARFDWQLSKDKLLAAKATRLSQHQDMAGALDDALADLGPASTPLRDVEQGELLLLTAPGRSGWLLFAATATSVVATPLGTLDPSASPHALARALLDPLDAQLADASTVSWLPWGPWNTLDVRALSWRGAPLGAAKPLSWRLDVPTHQAEHLRLGSLLVVDPTGSLPGARAEGALVAAVLPVAATELRGADATAERVRDALARVDMFHYAGHAKQAGIAGFDSALALRDSQLTAADVLMLAAVPRLVVLSGCETALAPASGVQALGLAQAFILAGSTEVVATLEPLDDVRAATVMQQFHAKQTTTMDAAQSLRALYADSRTSTDARNYRVFRP